MIRSFLAIALPDAVVDALEDVQTGLPGVVWIPGGNLHLTLLFLGEQPRTTLEDLDAQMIRLDAPAFDVSLRGVGGFGGRDARSLHARVEENPALRLLQAKVETAARAADISVDGRRYTPHVTLARLKRSGPLRERIGDWISAHDGFQAPIFEAREAVLFRSTLGRGGAVYEEIAAYPLMGGGDWEGAWEGAWDEELDGRPGEDALDRV